MLQKYHHPHSNPLTHFLALHNSQHNTNHNQQYVQAVHTMATANTTQQLHYQVQQQQQLHHQHNTSAAFLENQNYPQLNQQRLHHQQQHNFNLLDSHNSPFSSPTHTINDDEEEDPHHQLSNSLHSEELIEVTENTSLDAGKSFTIAAILGLQKTVMEQSQKDYNSVINLSTNGGNTSGNSNVIAMSPPNTNNKDEPNDTRTNNNNSSNMNKTSINVCNSFLDNNTNAITAATSSYNCDNTTNTVAAAAALMNRYLPAAMSSSSAVILQQVHHHQQKQHHQRQHQQHMHANSFIAGNPANSSVVPSALQSLQQLHQQHVHQTSLNFQRDKIKSDPNNKKSAMKNKRVRTIFTPEQLERLEAEFERQQYMVGPERLYLAHTLQLTEAQVKVWFQNRRIKWRKHHLEITQQRLALLRQTQLPGNKVDATENDDQAVHSISLQTNNDESSDEIKREEMRALSGSRHDTESELSICNDSMDVDDSLLGDEEET